MRHPSLPLLPLEHPLPSKRVGAVGFENNLTNPPAGVRTQILGLVWDAQVLGADFHL